MPGKMKLYIGLLVLGLAMVAGGLWFVFKPMTVGTFQIAVTPSPGNYLYNSQNMSSEVLLKDIQIRSIVSDKQYFSPRYPPQTVNAGEYIVEVSGTIQNKHKENDSNRVRAPGRVHRRL